VPGKDNPEGRDGYRLVAEIAPERADQASLILGTSVAGGVREQVFEFPEWREEIKVEKRPHVYEEVGLRKEVTERVADIHGTLRHTEVEVEEIPAEEPRPAARVQEPLREPTEPEPLRFGLRTRPE
jgi:stress response protein YsnF